jgi:hypothetical protein
MSTIDIKKVASGAAAGGALGPWGAVAGAGLSLAGQAWAAIKGGKANKANERMVNKQEQENESWYNNRRNYLDTTEGKSVTEQVRKAYEDRSKSDASTAAITGATPETEIAQKTEANQSYNDAIRQVASQGQQYTQQNEGMYRQGLSDVYNAKFNINQNKAANAAALGQNVGNMFGTAATAGLFDKKQPIEPTN